MYGARDLIDDNNVAHIYTERKYVCFVLKNGITVKLDPNKIPTKSNGSESQGG